MGCNNQLHRDLKCAEDVGLMAQLRRFDREHTAYGCVEFPLDGDIIYHSADEAERLFQHIQRRKAYGSCFTLFSETSRRCTVPSGYEEVLKQAIKHTLLSEMKASYTDVNFFAAMNPYFILAPNNTAYISLIEYRDEIEGYFDSEQLQLFWGLVERAYEGKVLSQNSYDEISAWYQNVKRQMEDDPINEDNLTRTFYGFVYHDGSAYQTFFDAKKVCALQEYQKKICAGYLVAPIIEKAYYFQQFGQMPKLRTQFKQWLLQTEDEHYFQRLRSIKELPGVVDRQSLLVLESKFTSCNEALETWKYYVYTWNERK